ncbi:tyrosine-type recombinase/integrase [Marisediminitalea sp.]|uniref:tyrosine-type recombinase/integrase n=1 Tax=Marisediminitalea sp. TaxID=2662268 RepID=UPI0035149ED6
MAILETIDHQPMVFDPAAKSADYGFVPNSKRKLEASFPQIFFSNGEPWHEANRYAFHRYYDLQKDIKTIHSGMSHLTRYAKWLEANNLHWLHFPKRKSERCLFQFRGHLIELRDNGLLAPSTASQVMNSVVAFYRWAAANNYAESSSRFFDSKVVKLSFLDSVGFRRTMGVVSSELAIPNRKRKGLQLEDGLVPISQASANKFLTFLAKHRNRELYLMSKVALQTGCRHETITTLNIDVLKNAYPDYKLSNILRVKVGPGTGVNTKFDVSGEIYFPSSLVNELIDYFNSAEAILRRSRANKALSKCVFITSRGNSYTRQTFGTLLYRLKDELIKAGHSEFGRFKFHQLRATFGTMLMRALMRTEGMSSLNAIEFVRDAMLHKDASVTWKYIKFIEREPIESQFLDTLWAIFTGSRDTSNEMIRHLTSGEVTREN